MFGLIPSPRTAYVLPLLAGMCLSAVAATTIGLGLQYRSQSDWVRHTEQVKVNLSQIFSLVQDAELGQRGYLLTGDEAYAQRIDDARIPFDTKISALLAMMADNPAQQAALVELRDLAVPRFETYADVGAPRRPEEFADRVTPLYTIRVIARNLEQHEETLLQQRKAEAAQTGVMLTLVALIAALLTGLGLATWLRDRQTSATNREDRTTERGEAAEALQESRDQTSTEHAGREVLEAQVHQLQKMEAVGQLTAGIAHDFNNMNAVVISAMSLIRRRLSKGDTNVGALLDAATDGAERSAKLTARLLAFARQQQLAPESLDPSKFTSGLTELLRRSLGETIRIETISRGELWRVYADPSQLENAILNLAVNARDAMPNGGKLTLETANVSLDDAYARSNTGVTAGQYVMIAVSDSGEGMTPEVIERAFEPFFTTKPIGTGTGLGLSQLFGFVKQSGGHVKIYSELGKGTTVKIYLPRDLENADKASEMPADRPAPAGAISEIILVVEDEQLLRDLAVAGLRDLGYTIIHADGGPNALRLLDQHPEISCLFTDIVMPEMSGRELADEALRRRPDLKVLYATGYARESVFHNRTLNSDANLLTKPYSLDDLALKMRSVLGPMPPQ
jgi:signal transduction histidine kinase/CheY-like chemotaxis protein